jgi:UDP-N-acetylmuramyl pentapeptide phosphotransferase/UDP-N-acetylglucosamine-1-phosphate transferase
MHSSSPLIWFSAALAGFAASATVTAWLAPVLRRHGAVARPGPDGLGRAVPRGGGLAIVAVATAAGLIAAWANPASRVPIAAWLVPGLAIAAVSLRDDFVALPAILRLAVAAVPLMVPPTTRAAILPVAVLAIWPFQFDAALTFVKRLIRRENVLEQHRGHIYQRLVIAGWSHRSVAGLYGCLAAVGGGIAAVGLLEPRLRATADMMTAAVVVITPVLLVTLAQTAEAGATCRA